MDGRKKELSFQPDDGGYCRQCGKQEDVLWLATISDGERTQSMALCRDCAKRLKTSFNRQNAQQAPEPAPQTPPMAQRPPVAQQQPMPQRPPMAQQQPMPQRPQQRPAPKKNPALIAVAVVLVLTILAGVGYLIFAPEKDDEPESKKEKTTQRDQSAAFRQKCDTLSVGLYAAAALHQDGTVTDLTNDGEIFAGWKNIVAVSAGGAYTVGLKKDGTVVATKLPGYKGNFGQCDVDDWTDIVAVSAGVQHTVGLKKDGTVVAVGNNEAGQCDVSGWRDIVAVSAGWYHTVGLKKDGTIVSTKLPDYYLYNAGQCGVSGWKNIVAVSAGCFHTVGLKKDGTVVSTKFPDDFKYNFGQCDVSGWKNIVAVSASLYHTVGLRKDGTVVSTKFPDGFDLNFGQIGVSGWRDIVAVSAGVYLTVGLKKDGTVVCTLEDFDESRLTDIRMPS